MSSIKIFEEICQTLFRKQQSLVNLCFNWVSAKVPAAFVRYSSLIGLRLCYFTFFCGGFFPNTQITVIMTFPNRKLNVVSV